jgi:hypothetical protein
VLCGLSGFLGLFKGVHVLLAGFLGLLLKKGTLTSALGLLSATIVSGTWLPAMSNVCRKKKEGNYTVSILNIPTIIINPLIACDS